MVADSGKFAIVHVLGDANQLFREEIEPDEVHAPADVMGWRVSL
jgi:hypothetical protein